MKIFLAELIGTFTLVLFGCGAAVIAGGEVGVLGISFAFGFALIAMAYGIGPISGCHINPAVSIAAVIAGRLEANKLVTYIGAQVLGALLAAGCLVLIVTGQLGGYDVAFQGLGQNGWGADYLGGYGLMSALIFEVVATFLFVVVILGATDKHGVTPVAGLAIGITLVVIHIVGIQITGVSVNPARSIGPAIFVGGTALSQLWLFIVAPILGGGLAGMLFKRDLLGGTA